MKSSDMGNIVINDTKNELIGVDDLVYNNVYYCIDNGCSYILTVVNGQHFLICLTESDDAIPINEAQEDFKSAKFIRCKYVHINVYGN